jgi:hypothetical protein
MLLTRTAQAASGEAPETPTPLTTSQRQTMEAMTVMLQTQLARRTSFGDGTWAAGDIVPGRYLATYDETCCWERLSCFDDTPDCVIASGLVNEAGSSIVDIWESDAGFTSLNCGTWNLLR